jgi:hypothetical protein
MDSKYALTSAELMRDVDSEAGKQLMGGTGPGGREWLR